MIEIFGNLNDDWEIKFGTFRVAPFSSTSAPL